jgi:hypothetical protein
MHMKYRRHLVLINLSIEAGQQWELDLGTYENKIGVNNRFYLVLEHTSKPQEQAHTPTAVVL